jgi:hypothetical protein
VFLGVNAVGLQNALVLFMIVLKRFGVARHLRKRQSGGSGSFSGAVLSSYPSASVRAVLAFSILAMNWPNLHYVDSRRACDPSVANLSETENATGQIALVMGTWIRSSEWSVIRGGATYFDVAPGISSAVPEPASRSITARGCRRGRRTLRNPCGKHGRPSKANPPEPLKGSMHERSQVPQFSCVPPLAFA